MIAVFLLVSVWIFFILPRTVFSAACENADHDDFCDAGVPKGDCWFISNRFCRCSKSCEAPPNCGSENNDTDCMCFSLAYLCPAILSSCPTTCDRRTSIPCQPLPSFANASPSLSLPAYGDKVTYTCNEGYEKTGGNTGLRACVEHGVWFVHTVDGIPPVCQPVSCGAPPVLQNFIPSKTAGYYGDVVSYLCPEKMMKIGGGIAKCLCNGSAHWEIEITDSVPICKDLEIHFRNSAAEITGAVPPNMSQGRSNVDCAHQCALMDKCYGYTFTAASMACSFNVVSIDPVTTKMKII